MQQKGQPAHSNQDEIEFEDSETFMGGSSKGATRRDIVLGHFKRCIEAGSKEMSAGGVIKRLIDGEIQEFMVPNNRQIFKNHIMMLHMMMLPDLKRYKDEEPIKTHLNAFKSKEELNKNEFIKSKRTITATYNSKPKGERHNYADWLNKYIKNLEEAHENESLEIHRNELLPALVYIMQLLNYFEEQSATYVGPSNDTD